MYTRLRTYTIQWKQGKGLFPINIIIIIHKNINFNVFISNLFIVSLNKREKKIDERYIFNDQVIDYTHCE